MSVLDGRDVAKTIVYVKAGETVLLDFEFSGELPTGRTISGTPTIVESGSRTIDSNEAFVASSDLTITNVNGSGSTVNGLVTGVVADTEYLVTCTCTDSGVPAQTLQREGRVRGQP